MHIPVSSREDADMTVGGEAESLFQAFSTANSLDETLAAFKQLCVGIGLDSAKAHSKEIYRQMKIRVQSLCGQRLWGLLDKRAAHKEYMQGKACQGNKVCTNSGVGNG